MCYECGKAAEASVMLQCATSLEADNVTMDGLHMKMWRKAPLKIGEYSLVRKPLRYL